MIKDSKIIGTKIAAPYGWKKFKVGELFDVIRSVNDDFSLLTISYDDRVDGVSYVNCSTAGINNNGCPLVIERKYVNLENVLNYGITVSANGANTGSVFVQSSDFIVLQDSYCLILKSGNKNVFVYQFLATLLFKYKVQFNYQTKASWTRLSTLSISLPVLPNSQPDFAWMEQYMKLVQEDYLQQKKLNNQAEIKAYLTESQTDSLEITHADREFLHEFEKLPRRKFNVGELFDYKSSKSLNKGDLTFVSSNSEFSIPYITRTVLNNGINGYVDSRLLSPEYINRGSEFAFGLMGLTAFYQSGKYCTGQFVKRFVPKFKINSLLSLYFKTMLDRQIEMFKTVSIRSYDALINDVIQLELPVRPDSQVDVESIEKYMRIHSKPLVKNVVETLTSAGATN